MYHHHYQCFTKLFNYLHFRYDHMMDALLPRILHLTAAAKHPPNKPARDKEDAVRYLQMTSRMLTVVGVQTISSRYYRGIDWGRGTKKEANTEENKLGKDFIEFIGIYAARSPIDALQLTILDYLNALQSGPVVEMKCESISGRSLIARPFPKSGKVERLEVVPADKTHLEVDSFKFSDSSSNMSDEPETNRQGAEPNCQHEIPEIGTFVSYPKSGGITNGSLESDDVVSLPRDHCRLENNQETRDAVTDVTRSRPSTFGVLESDDVRWNSNSTYGRLECDDAAFETSYEALPYDVNRSDQETTGCFREDATVALLDSRHTAVKRLIDSDDEDSDHYLTDCVTSPFQDNNEELFSVFGSWDVQDIEQHESTDEDVSDVFDFLRRYIYIVVFI